MRQWGLEGSVRRCAHPRVCGVMGVLGRVKMGSMNMAFSLTRVLGAAGLVEERDMYTDYYYYLQRENSYLPIHLGCALFLLPKVTGPFPIPSRLSALLGWDVGGCLTRCPPPRYNSIALLGKRRMGWGRFGADEVRVRLTSCFDRSGLWEVGDTFWLDRWRQVQAERARGTAEPQPGCELRPGDRGCGQRPPNHFSQGPLCR